jgi:F-type H+-transporting ATPase subunit b
MITLDLSIIAAIVIFLLLIFALNRILFKPLQKILAERESRTTGLINKARENTDAQLQLFNAYQMTIKNARMEGYRRQEQVRTEAMNKRAELLAAARESSEQLIRESRDIISSQVEKAYQQLASEAQEMAQRISAIILERESLKVE